MSMPNPTAAQAATDDEPRQREQPGEVQERRRDRASRWFGVQPVRSSHACQGAGTAFMPYLLSTLDTLAWRYNVPEMVYPEALIPGARSAARRSTFGATSTRGGFLHQTDDYKSGAVVAQRAMSSRGACSRTSTSRCSRVRATATGGRRPDGERCLHGQVAGADADLSNSCAVFPHSNTRRPSKATTPGRCGGPMLLPAPRASSAASISEVFPMKASLSRFAQRARPYALSIALACAVTAAAGVAWAQTRISPTGVGVSGSVIGDDVLYIGGAGLRVHGRRREHAEHRRGHRLEQQPDLRRHEHHDDAAEPANGLTNGFQQIMSSVIQSATSAVASLPAHLQRADPGLYNLLTNGVLQARLDFDRSKLTCKAMANRMADTARARCAMQPRAPMRCPPWSKIEQGQQRRALGGRRQRGRPGFHQGGR